MNRLYLSALLLLLMTIFALPSVQAANPPQPTYGTAVVDGDPGEWDLMNDFFSYMYRAGKPDKPIESSLYLRYDCSTGTMYVLVLTFNEIPGIASESDAWGAINAVNNKVFTGASGNDGTPPDFAWVGLGYDGDPTHVQGYEASFTIAPGTYTYIGHIEVFDDNAPQTSATPDFPQDGVELVIMCPSPTEPGIRVTKLVSVDGGMTYVDAETPPGPSVLVGDDVYFKFIVTNAGNTDLTNVTVVDDTYGTVITITTLAVGASSEQIIGPFAAEAGLHTDIATATGYVDNTPYTDTDNGNYTGEEEPNPQIDLTKFTNGEEAVNPPGPSVLVGDPIEWTFVVENTGNVDLTNVTITDDQLGLVCTIPSLPVGATETCTVNGTAVEGQYENTATASGFYEDQEVTDQATSHYFATTEVVPGIRIVKLTQGQECEPNTTGPVIPIGDAVTWTYIVTNTGNITLTNVTVTDDKEGQICTAATLAPGASLTCTLTGTAIAGQYNNIATATGNYDSSSISDQDDGCYFGAKIGICIIKKTNGCDANCPPGPFIPVGGTVTWTYIVRNTGEIDLENVTVVDDKLGLIGTIDLLAPGEVQILTATGVAVAGQYENTAVATGNAVGSAATVTDSDISHYFGGGPKICLKKYISVNCGKTYVDANCPPWPTVYIGKNVYYKFVITNTGTVTLNNIDLNDDELECYRLRDEYGAYISCLPDKLEPGQSFVCYVGPVRAYYGYHKNTAMATGYFGCSKYTSYDSASYYGISWTCNPYGGDSRDFGDWSPITSPQQPVRL